MNNKFRITYAKGQALRYTANLDMHKIWERWMRRAKIPLAYSQGFHSQPRMNQAAPLPLGMLSDCEIIDVWVDEGCSLEDLAKKLSSTPQPGISVVDLIQILQKEDSIQTRVHHIEYRVECLEAISSIEIEKAIEQVLGSNSIVRERRNKEYDLRPLILELSCQRDPENQKQWVRMVLMSLPGKTGRPDEVIIAMNLEPANFRYTRSHIYLSANDESK